jgi:hypothetical protein
LNTDFEREINKTDNIDVLREKFLQCVRSYFFLVRGSQYYEINFLCTGGMSNFFGERNLCFRSFEQIRSVQRALTAVVS